MFGPKGLSNFAAVFVATCEAFVIFVAIFNAIFPLQSLPHSS
jgi:hypothetical protein